ncbi:MAG: PAS domain S-box protein [Candidatus Aenigmatarchaeota archaeon]
MAGKDLRGKFERKLRFDEEVLRDVLVSMDDIVFVLDKNGIFRNYYQSEKSILFVPPNKFLNRHFRDVLPEYLVKLVRSALQQLKKTGKAQTIEYYLDMNSQRKWFNANISFLRMSNKIEGFIVVARDITERKKMENDLRENEEKFRMIFENVSDEIVYVDKNGVVLDVNKKSEEVIGYKPEEMIGKNFMKLDFFDLKTIPKIIKIFNDIVKGNVIDNLELEVKHRKGHTVPVEIGVKLIKKNGKTEGMVCTIRNITERRKSENLIRIERDLAISLNSVHEVRRAMITCLEHSLNASEMDCGGVYLFDESTGDLDLISSKGLSKDFVRNVSHFGSESLNVKLIKKRKPIYTQHEKLGVQLSEAERKEDLRAIAVIPICHEDEVIGSLNISSHTLNEVSAFSRAILETIAAQIGSVFTRLRAEEHLNNSKRELEFKVDDLERFSKMTVGRELKMTELKKRVRELEAKLVEKGGK